jgi:DNA gyrase subunit A
MLKKSLISELPGPSSQTFTLVKINEGDRLGWVALAGGKKKDILLVTARGMAIRFSDEDVRPMGLMAAGVNGMKLDDKDELVGLEILPSDGEVFLVASDGKAKRIDQKEFPSQGRYGKGVRAWDLPNKVKLAGVVTEKASHMATIHLSKGAPKSTRLDAAAVRKRAATKGDVVVEVKPGEEVVSVNVGWMVDKFVKPNKPEPEKPAAQSSSMKGKKIGKKPTAKKAPLKKGKKSTAKRQVAKKPAAKAKKKSPKH